MGLTYSIKSEREREREGDELVQRRIAGMEAERNRLLNKVIEKNAENKEAEREMIGDQGHWVQATGVINDGREQWAVYDINKVHHGNFWGKDVAERAVYQLIKGEMISR